MSYVMSELVIEGVLREGLTALRRDPSLVTDIFEKQLTQGFFKTKYGQKELNKITDFFSKKDVAIVHAYYQVPANAPCISIQLLDNPEWEGKQSLDDHSGMEESDMTPEELQDARVADPVMVTDYNPKTGKCSIDDSSDLSEVKRAQFFVDATGHEFKILRGVSDVDGAKAFYIAKGQDPDISDFGYVQASIQFHQTEIRGIREEEKLILGVHTKEALMTKYLYVAVKYILSSRKKDIIERGYQNTKYSGSDFTRNLNYPGDQVFNRFLNVSGFVEQEWRSDKVVPIDAVDVIVTVARDEATTADLGKQTQTVQVQDDDEQGS